MRNLTNKLQNIRVQLNGLLPQINQVNAINFNSLPIQIEKAVFGTDKINSVFCKSIKNLSKNDFDGVTRIEGLAFTDCTSLINVVIPDSVTSIGSGAFGGCTSLKSITIPFVGGNATDNNIFAYIFGNYASDVPKSLTNVIISNNCTDIGDNAFYNCTRLINITIGKNITSIGSYAFDGCTGLKSITIPDGVTSIGFYAFYGCTGLKSITIPDGVTSIYEGVFQGCSGLAEATIGRGITSIGYYAFSGCIALTDIYLKSIVPPTLDDMTAIPDTTTIHVPVGSGDAYKSATNWSYHSSRIVEDLQST